MNYNYYHILAVPTTADAREIKKAYKQLAIQYHPDKHQGNAYYEEKFKQVSEAYQVLSNPHKRAVYDLKLQFLLRERLRQAAQQHRYRYQAPVRRPASVSERYYHKIPQTRFVRRDWYIVAMIFAGILVLSLLLKLVMDQVAARDNYRQALEYLDQREWTRAHSFLSQAIEFKPDYAEAYMKRAYIEMEIYHDYQAALPDLDAAIANASVKTAQMYYLRGLCHESLQNSQVAELNLNQAISQDRNFALAYYDRGLLRARSLKKFPEAIVDLTFFLESGPADQQMRGEALLYRGFCYYLTQQEKAALGDYRQALQQSPGSARLYYLMGKVQMELDSASAACGSFQKASSLGYGVGREELQLACAPLP
ncbi:MAG: DnaJ domain-containing protein [Adhaeribacter sp.]